MISRRHLLILLVLATAVSLMLAGCVRPIPGGDDTETTPTETVDTTDPNVGGGVAIEPTAMPGDQHPVTEEEGETAQPAETTEGGEEMGEETPAESGGDTTGEDQNVGGGVPEESSDTTAETPAETAETETTEGATTTEEPAATTTETETAVTTTATGPVYHTVAAGENLYRIGLKYGLSWVPIAQVNGLPNANWIYIGQQLLIPTGGIGNPGPVPGTTYIVQPGDNLFRIGLKFGISWIQIAEANGIVNPNYVRAGMTLKIPTAQPGPTPSFTHIVGYGETLYSISLRYGVPWQSIAAANNLSSPYNIYAGQPLVIPGS